MAGFFVMARCVIGRFAIGAAAMGMAGAGLAAIGLAATGFLFRVAAGPVGDGVAAGPVGEGVAAGRVGDGVAAGPVGDGAAAWANAPVAPNASIRQPVMSRLMRFVLPCRSAGRSAHADIGRHGETMEAVSP